MYVIREQSAILHIRGLTMNKSILPSAIQDKNNLALEQCIIKAFNIDTKKLLLFPIENVDEDLLPILAKEYHVLGYEGWNLAKNKEQKQKLIKNSFKNHCKKGTMPSLVQALANLGMEAELEEFDKYGGKPSHFRFKFLNIFERELDSKLQNDIKELIKIYKPATRKLDSIMFFLCSKAYIYYIPRIKTSKKITLKTKGVAL